MANTRIEGFSDEKLAWVCNNSAKKISEYFYGKSRDCVLWINTTEDRSEECTAVDICLSKKHSLYRICNLYHDIKLPYSRIMEAMKEYSWADNETYFLVYNYMSDEFYVRARYDRSTEDMRKFLQGMAFNAIMLGKWELG